MSSPSLLSTEARLVFLGISRALFQNDLLGHPSESPPLNLKDFGRNSCQVVTSSETRREIKASFNACSSPSI